jgi:prevent-host-death family protein
MNIKKQSIVGLREFREKTSEYLKEIEKGKSFTVFRRSEPLFVVSPVENDEQWEEVIDFTKFKKGGVDIEEILKRL